MQGLTFVHINLLLMVAAAAAASVDILIGWARDLVVESIFCTAEYWTEQNVFRCSFLWNLLWQSKYTFFYIST